MISQADKEYSQLEIETILEGPIREWFRSKYAKFTPPQKYAIMEIHEGRNIVVCSPTGSGKTLSAFLSILNELIKLGRNWQLEDRIYVVYISPLKALNNDIKKNLEEPLAEIKKEFEKKGARMPEIRIAVRTGDSSQTEKSKMLKKPPHILITTPESIAIILNAPKFSQTLEHVEYVVVDEIHALAENKRGAHLSLSLERLAAKCVRDFTRIGLSATIHPLDEVAKFLVGNERTCKFVDVNYLKKTKIDIASPVEDKAHYSSEKTNAELYELLDKIISTHRTTLIFTNTRNATERAVHYLRTKFGEKYIENIAAHHSSLSREHRLETEERLKNGELKAVISSTSLELGIDIGNIDIVVLVGSPKSASRALQRIGRSGHRLHENSQGVIIALDRNDLIEITVLAHNARNKKIDKVRIYKNALDVLAQHIVGMGLEHTWDANDAFRIIKKSYCYSDLCYEDFDRVLKYLSGYFSTLEENFVYSKIWYDGKEFGKRGRFTRAIYSMNIGTIPNEPKLKVFFGKKYLGEVEEEFAENLVIGDVFVLGGKTYEFVGSYATKVSVVLSVIPAESKSPTVPTWFSESLPLSYELAMDIEKFRWYALAMSAEELSIQYEVNEKTAKAILDYLNEQKQYSKVPDETEFLVEEWRDDDGLLNYIFHSVCGRKANDAIARVFAYELGKKKNCNITTTVSDYGFVLRFPKQKYITRLDIEEALWIESFDEKLILALENTEMIKRRFKNVATRSYLILKRYLGRRYFGGETLPGRQRINSEILFNIIRKNILEFPMLKETYNEIMQDAMHVDESMDYIEKLRRRKLIMITSDIPSQFAFNLVALGSKNIMAIEDRKEFIKNLRL
ncbi:MAG: ATP-dependent helicase [Candidatus Micrarchaeota archaeon]